LSLEIVVSNPTDCIARRPWEGSIKIVVGLWTEEFDESDDDSAGSGVSCPGTSPATVINSGSDGGFLERERDTEVDPELVDGGIRFSADR
jgi:hypothetical protein